MWDVCKHEWDLLRITFYVSEQVIHDYLRLLLHLLNEACYFLVECSTNNNQNDREEEEALLLIISHTILAYAG